MPRYSDPSFGDTKQLTYPGKAGTTLVWTPKAGTSAGTKTTTEDGESIGFWKAVKIKQIVYTVKTVQTGTGDNINFILYVDGTAYGTLAVTTEVGSSVCTSSVINATCAAGKVVKIREHSIRTASDDSPAIGFLSLTYQELFDNVDR